MQKVGLSGFVREIRPQGMLIGGLYYNTLTWLKHCDRCGGGIPWQGPLRRAPCPKCQEINEFQPDSLATLLQAAAQGAMANAIAITYSDRGHPCPKCDTPLDFEAIPLEGESARSCAKCGTIIAAFQPPGWLKEQLPGLRLLIGAEREPSEGDIPSEQPLEGAVAGDTPASLSCPNCKGDLSITKQTERTLQCEYCQASIYIPDGLWQRFHPVDKTSYWTFVFEGPELKTRSDIRYEQEQQRQQAEQERRRQAQQAAASQREAETVEKKGGLGVVLIVLFVLAGAGVAIYFLMP